MRNSQVHIHIDLIDREADVLHARQQPYGFWVVACNKHACMVRDGDVSSKIRV